MKGNNENFISTLSRIREMSGSIIERVYANESNRI